LPEIKQRGADAPENLGWRSDDCGVGKMVESDDGCGCVGQHGDGDIGMGFSAAIVGGEPELVFTRFAEGNDHRLIMNLEQGFAGPIQDRPSGEEQTGG
jgi:hypothetical protein